MIPRQKEIALILGVFLVLLFISLSAKFYGLYGTNNMHKFTSTISNHPLEVSNAALKFQLELYRINAALDATIRQSTKEKILESANRINIYKQSAEQNFQVINQLILGEEGRVLASDTNELFQEWISVSDQAISLFIKGKGAAAQSLLERKGDVIAQLDASASKINKYAREKGIFYQKQSDELYNEFKKHNYLVILTVMILFISFTYYIVRRLSSFMIKNEQLNKQLSEKMTELEKIVQEAPNPIMLHTEDGTVVTVNKVWQELTGYSVEEIDTIGKWIQKAYGLNIDAVQGEIDRLFTLDTKVDTGEYTIKTKGGETLIWKFSSTLLGIINGQKTVISSAMDITDLKAKDELILMQSRYTAIGEMIGMIAHQWRQPLSVISMDANNILVDIALGKLEEESLTEISNQILEQTAYLSNTINDFRNFFKSEGKGENISVDKILEETQSLLFASLKNNEISLQVENLALHTIDINQGELIQVLINLINNAKDAVTQHAHDDKKIKISVSEDEVSFIFRVCDNGGGIDTSIMEKIFDPYFTTKENLNGCGLGLYMSKLIITQNLKGTITTENKDEGACFTIRLPKR